MDLVTTAGFVDEVRSQSDEENTVPRTDIDILKMANRGVRLMNELLATHHHDPLVAVATIDLQNGVASYDLPQNIFEDRVEDIVIDTPGVPSETQRRGSSEAARLAVPGATAVPWSWEIRGRELFFQQTPNGTFDAKMIYLKQLENLVAVSGRITTVDPAGAYLIVDTTGFESELVANADQLGSFFNVCSWLNGEIKATYQVQSIVDSKITLRAIPTRTSVQGRTIEGVVDPDSDVEVDDYVALSSGTCVPELRGAMYNFLVEFTVAALGRSLTGGDPAVQLQESILKQATRRVADQALSRPLVDRVQNRSAAWPRLGLRWPWSSR